jgi:excisionase family DNA binding protein
MTLPAASFRGSIERAKAVDEPTMGAFSPLFTLNEAAKILRVSKSWIERRIREQRLRAVKLGSLTRIAKADLDAFVALAPAAAYRGASG